MILVIALLSACSPSHAAAVSEGDHPIVGVISLLQRLTVQAHQEGETEAQLFQKFVYWCKNSEKQLNKAIAKEDENILSLTDQIAGLKSDISTLKEEIGDLDDQLTKMDVDASKAKKIRDEENELYKSEQSNFGETIDAVDTAIDVMKDSKSSLSQKSQTVVKKAVFLAERIEGKPTRPEPKAYNFKSGSIIETFKGMNGAFEEQKLDSDQAETAKQNSYNLAKDARDRAITAAEESKSEKESIKSDKEQTKASAETDLGSEQTAHEADTTTLQDTQKDCKAKSDEWDARSSTRSGEIEAMTMAVKILTKVSGVRNPDSHEIPTKSLVQAASTVDEDTANFNSRLAPSFLQLKDPKAKAVIFLKQAAKRLKNRALQKLAAELGTYNGPFDQIKQMINKMVFRLMAEQKDEDDQKNWCDLETDKSTESKEDKKDKMENYQDRISEAQTAINELSRKISDNSDKLKELTEYKKEETDMRKENHEEITATIKDAVDAQAAVTQAISVLKEFYKSSGMIAKEPWEFVQVGRGQAVNLPDSPSTWDSSYTGAADPNAGGEGVLAILDGCMDKFSEMEADAKVADNTDQKNFDTDMADTKTNMEEVKMDSEMKGSKKDALQEKLEGMATELKHTSSEFDAVKQYLKDLEPACGSGDSSFEDRKQARTDEVEALKKAQTILEEAFQP